MPLNNNNFLRWSGIVNAAPFTFTFVPNTIVTLFADQESNSVNLPSVSTIVSTNGVDYTSLNIVSIVNNATALPIELTSPLSWDSSTETLTFFRPTDTSVSNYTIEFYISDMLGNISSICNLVVTVSPIFTTWIAYPVSAVCLLDNFGNNTGYKGYGSLQLVNMSTDIAIAPLQLKDNVQGDPDYVTPLQDYVTCPPPGAGSGNYASFIVSNNSKNSADPNNFITITNVFLSSSNMGPGSTPFVQNIPCNIPPGKSVRFSVPASGVGFTYDGGISISYLVTGNMITANPLRFWYQNNAGAVTGFPSGGSVVDNSGIIVSGGSFDISTNGITIFAQ